MEAITVSLIALAYLVVLSLIDIGYKGRAFAILPSALTTFFPILTLFLASNISNYSTALFGLVVFSLFAFMFYELKVFEGSQDIKIMMGLGCLVIGINQIVLLLSVIVVFSFFYKAFIKVIVKRAKQIPFIPVLMFSYCAYLMILTFMNQI